MQRQPDFMATNQSIPLVLAQHRLLYKTVRGLAITQILVGILSVLLGVLALILGVSYNNQYQGLWAGVWVFVTGIIGLTSSKNPNSCCMTGVYMSFSIVSTILSFFSGIVFVTGILHYSNCYVWSGFACRDDIVPAALGVMIPFFLAMIVEFVVSIIATAYACKSSNVCTSCTEHNVPTTQQQQQYQISPGSYESYPVTINYPALRDNGISPEFPIGYPQNSVAMSPPGQGYNNHVLPKHGRSHPASSDNRTVYTMQPTCISSSNTPPPPYV